MTYRASDEPTATTAMQAERTRHSSGAMHTGGHQLRRRITRPLFAKLSPRVWLRLASIAATTSTAHVLYISMGARTSPDPATPTLAAMLMLVLVLTGVYTMPLAMLCARLRGRHARWAAAAVGSSVLIAFVSRHEGSLSMRSIAAIAGWVAWNMLAVFAAVRSIDTASTRRLLSEPQED